MFWDAIAFRSKWYLINCFGKSCETYGTVPCRRIFGTSNGGQFLGSHGWSRYRPTAFKLNKTSSLYFDEFGEAVIRGFRATNSARRRRYTLRLRITAVFMRRTIASDVISVLLLYSVKQVSYGYFLMSRKMRSCRIDCILHVWLASYWLYRNWWGFQVPGKACAQAAGERRNERLQ